MIILDTTTKKLQVLLAGAKATNDCPWVVGWVETKASTFPAPGSANGVTNGVTAVDTVPVPSGASTYRQLKGFSLFNADTAPVTVILRYNDNGTTRDVYKAAVPVGYSLEYEDGFGWDLHDTSGATVSASTPAFATPAIVLGTAAAAGVAGTAIRSDSTILAFDATTPATIAADGAGAVGAAAVAARRDHNHPFATSATAGANCTPGAAAVAGTSGHSPSRDDHTHRSPGGVASITAQADVVNSETAVASFQFPAGLLQVGSVIRIVAAGVHTTSTSPGNCTITIKINTTTKGATIVVTGTVASVASITTQPFWMEAIITVRSATTAVATLKIFSSNVTTGAFSTSLTYMVSSTSATTISNVSNSLFVELCATTGASTSHLLFQNAEVELIKL